MPCPNCDDVLYFDSLDLEELPFVCMCNTCGCPLEVDLNAAGETTLYKLVRHV